MLHQGSFLKIQLHDMGFKDSVIMGEVVFSCTDGWVSKFDGFVDMSGVNATPGSWRTSFSGVPVLDVQILYDDVDHHPIVPSAPPGPDPVDVASVQGLTPGPDSVQGPAVQGLGLPIHAFQGYNADFQVDYGPSPRSEVQGPSLRSEVLRSSDQGLGLCLPMVDPCHGTQIVIKDDVAGPPMVDPRNGTQIVIKDDVALGLPLVPGPPRSLGPPVQGSTIDGRSASSGLGQDAAVPELVRPGVGPELVHGPYRVNHDPGVGPPPSSGVTQDGRMVWETTVRPGPDGTVLRTKGPPTFCTPPPSAQCAGQASGVLIPAPLQGPPSKSEVYSAQGPRSEVYYPKFQGPPPKSEVYYPQSEVCIPSVVHGPKVIQGPQPTVQCGPRFEVCYPSTVQGPKPMVTAPPARDVSLGVVELCIDASLWERVEWKLDAIQSSLAQGIPVPGVKAGVATMAGLMLGFVPCTEKSDYAQQHIFPATQLISEDIAKKAQIIEAGLFDIMEDVNKVQRDDGVLWGWWVSRQYAGHIAKRELVWGPMAAWTVGLGGSVQLNNKKELELVDNNGQIANSLDHVMPNLNMLHAILVKAHASMGTWHTIAPMSVPAAANIDNEVRGQNLKRLKHMFCRRDLSMCLPMNQPRNGTQIVIKDDLVLGLHSFRQSDCPQQFMQNSSLGITDNEESWWIASTGTWSPPRSNRPRRRVVTPPSPQAYCHTTCQLTYSSSCLHFASALSPIVWR